MEPGNGSFGRVQPYFHYSIYGNFFKGHKGQNESNRGHDLCVIPRLICGIDNRPDGCKRTVFCS